MRSFLKRILSALTNSIVILITYSVIAFCFVFVYGSSTVNYVLKSAIQTQSESISAYMKNVYTSLEILSYHVESNIQFSLNGRFSELTIDSSQFEYTNDRVVMHYNDNDGNDSVAISLEHSLDNIRRSEALKNYINAIVISGKSFNKVADYEYINIFFLHEDFIGMAPSDSEIKHIFDTDVYNRNIWLDYADVNVRKQSVETSDSYRCYTNNDIITLYIAIYNKTEFQGVLGLDLYTETFDELIDDDLSHLIPSIMIYNDRGSVITCTSDNYDPNEYINLENIKVKPTMYYSKGYFYFHHIVPKTDFNISGQIHITDWLLLILRETWVLTVVFILIFLVYFLLRKRMFALDKFIKTDYLTGAYSRNKFASDFNEKKLNGKLIAYIDVNKFKRINDNFGHSFGDWYLIQITKRLGCNDRFDVYRNSGDEFFIASKRPMTEQVFKSIMPLLSKPVYNAKNNLTIDVSVSLGIIENIDDSIALEDLLVYIDYAMYKAKEAGEVYTVVDKKLMDDYNSQKAKENRLIEDIDNGSLFPYYHPIIDNFKNTVAGFEILARWEYQEKVLPALAFMTAAKKINYMKKIDKLMFDKAQNDFLIFKNQGHDIDHYFFSFNISPTTIDLFNSNIREFDLFVENRTIDKDKIIFEISEEINLSKVSHETINSILDRGYKIVIDDFGTGSSNLSDIMNYKFYAIKTDMSMLPESKKDESKHLGFCFLVDIINTINSRVCVEGVETNEQLDIVKYTGAKYAQGYLFSKPASLDKALKFSDDFFKPNNL